MRWSADPVRVRVPASSANLGPGYDALGLALTLHDVVDARIMGQGLAVRVSGEGVGTLDVGEGHLVVRAMRATFALLGGQPPGLAIRCVNRIPQARGLGSSAAAVVAGILAARALTVDGAGRLPGDAVLRLATELEGHPDNVAACLSGGLTIAWLSPGGPRAVRLSPLAAVLPVVCVPPTSLTTEAARRVLPERVPHADAAANAGRSALLIAALTREPGLLFDATTDFLHQPYRAAVLPETAKLVGRLRAAGIPAVVSGAGPSVLAFLVRSRDDRAARDTIGALDSIVDQTGIPWHVRPLDVDRRGARIQLRRRRSRHG